jgi:hypothetical protein
MRQFSASSGSEVRLPCRRVSRGVIASARGYGHAELRRRCEAIESRWARFYPVPRKPNLGPIGGCLFSFAPI